MKFRIIIFVIGILPMNAVIADTNYNQPLFSLDFNIYGMGAEIRLNDIPVYYHDAQGQTASEKPVPETIIDGENTLRIRSFPLKEDGFKYQAGAYVEAIITVREKDAPLNASKPVLQIKLNPSNSNEQLLIGSVEAYGENLPKVIEHSDKEIVVERSVKIKSPFPRWAWQDGQDIQNTPENLAGLLDKYKEIWSALKSKDMQKIKELYAPAAAEFATAYHYNDIQQGYRLMNAGGLANDDDWMLADLNKLMGKMRYKIDVYGNGKLAQISDQDRRTPIVYLNKKVKMLNIQKFGFYKNKNGEWIMIR